MNSMTRQAGSFDIASAKASPRLPSSRAALLASLHSAAVAPCAQKDH